MTNIILKEIKLEKTRQKLLEPIKLDIVLDCIKQIDDEIEFTIIYNGDAETDEFDQIVCDEVIGPIPKGRVGFSLETKPPVIEDIPMNQIFGLTSFILVGKYKEQQFIRIGYFVNVEYPGIPNEKLTDLNETNEQAANIEEESEGTEENEPEFIDEEAAKEFKEEEVTENNFSEIKEELEKEIVVGEGEKEENEEETNEEKGENEEEEKEEENSEERGEDEGEENEEVENEGEEYSNENDEFDEGEEDEIIFPEIRDDGKIEIFDNLLDKNLIEIDIIDPPLTTVYSIKWDENEESIVEGEYEIEDDVVEDENVKRQKVEK